jgi:hypothetical protein
MKSFAVAAFTAISLAVAALGPVSPALAAPSGPGSVQNTLDALKANGFHVVINRVGVVGSMDGDRYPKGRSRHGFGRPKGRAHNGLCRPALLTVERLRP